LLGSDIRNNEAQPECQLTAGSVVGVDYHNIQGVIEMRGQILTTSFMYNSEKMFKKSYVKKIK
jgi:hypothetical protein